MTRQRTRHRARRSRLQPEKRKIAEEFYDYMKSKNLLHTWQRSDLLEEYSKHCQLGTERPLSLSSVLFHLARMRPILVQVRRGVNVIFSNAPNWKINNTVPVDANRIIVTNKQSKDAGTNRVQRVRDYLINKEDEGILLNSNGITITNVTRDVKEVEPGWYVLKTNRDLREATVDLRIRNDSDVPVTLNSCELLSKSKDFSIEQDGHQVIEVKSPLTVSLHCLQNFEVCATEIVFAFSPFNSGRTFRLIRYVKFTKEHSPIVSILAPTSHYVPPPKKSEVRNIGILEGKKPPKLAGNKLKSVVPLREHSIPNLVRRIVKEPDVFYSDNIPKDEHRKEVRELWDRDLDFESYDKKFSLLLQLEEIQQEVDIRMYDMKSVMMERKKNLLYLKVAGLAEKRPSVLRGDRVVVSVLSSDKKAVGPEYEGHVHIVQELKVGLGFHDKLLEKFIAGMKFNVRFVLSRYQFKLMHRSLTLLKEISTGRSIAFPNTERTIVQELNWPPYNKNIAENPEQKNAVTNILDGHAKVYIVFGPSGTGKTVTIVEAALQTYCKFPGAHILLCAPSNSACDVITERILRHASPSDVFRINAQSRNWRTVRESITQVCNAYRNIENDQNSELPHGDYYYPPRSEIMKYKIVLCTLITAGRLASAKFPEHHFTHIFIDEAGHAMEPEFMVAVAGILGNGGKIIMAGDPKQLGPIVKSKHAKHKGLDISFMERIMNTLGAYKRKSVVGDDFPGQYNQCCITKLTNNYRSHEAIIRIPNEKFYDNELKVCADELIRNTFCRWTELPCRDFPVIFHGIAGEDQREASSPSYFNPQEAAVVNDYVRKLLSMKGRKVKPSEIGIITPYNKQVEKMKQIVKDRAITVGSVEEFQGQERLVIIISTVRSDAQHLSFDAKFNLGFIRNPKRFNVALTRAKALLIIVGNPRLLCFDDNWNALLQLCMSKKAYCGIEFKGKEDISGPNIAEIEALYDTMVLPAERENELLTGGPEENRFNAPWREDP